MTLLRKTVGEIVREQASFIRHRKRMSIRNMGFGKHIRSLMRKQTNLQKHLLAWASKKGKTLLSGQTIKGNGYLANTQRGRWGQSWLRLIRITKLQNLEYLMKQSDATTLILDESFKGTSYIDIIRTVCPELALGERVSISSGKLPHFKRIILMTEREEQGMYKWSEFMAQADKVTDEQLEEAISIA